MNTQQLEDRIAALERLVSDHMTEDEKRHFMRNTYQHHATARMSPKQLRKFNKTLDAAAPFTHNGKEDGRYDGEKHDAALAEAYAAAEAVAAEEQEADE